MKFVRSSYLGVAIGVATLLPQSAVTQQWSTDQQEVWAAVEALWDASESGSVSAWDATMSEDYRGLSTDDAGPTTKEQGRSWRENFVATRLPVARSLIPMAIDIHGDVAIVFYGYQNVTKNPAGEETFERGRWMDVYRRTNGRWLLIADYGGATP